MELNNNIYEQDNTIRSFLKENKEKNNIHYLILNTDPISFVDIRNLALKLGNPDEKLKSIKQGMPKTEHSEKEELMEFLIKSGTKVIDTNQGYFDYFDVLNLFLDKNYDFLDYKLDKFSKDKIFAIEAKDPISSAKKIFIEQKVNHLPIMEDSELVGELRLCDLLTQDLYDTQKVSIYDERQNEPTINNEAYSIGNTKPLTIEYGQSIKDAVEVMLKKKVSSLIVTKEGEIFSIVTYRDIFKLYSQENEKIHYSLEFVGLKDLYDDEKALIEEYSEKTMEKIASISKYDSLKLSVKTIGQDSGHQKKAEVNILVSYGNHVLTVHDEISPGTSDEEFNDRDKKDWNIVLMIQDLLKNLENMVIDEKKKNQ